MNTFSKRSASHQTRAFFTAFFPVALISIVFAVVYIEQRFSDLDSLLSDQLEQISISFSATSEYAIVFSDKDVLSRLMKTVLERPITTSIHVYDTKQRIIAELGSKTAPQQTELFSKNTQFLETNEQLIIIQPIYSNSIEFISSTNSMTDYITPTNQEQISGWVKIKASKHKNKLKKQQIVSVLLIIILIFNVLYTILLLKLIQHFLTPFYKIENTIQQLSVGNFLQAKSLEVPPSFNKISTNIINITEKLENYREEIQLSIEQATEDIRRNMDSIEEKSAQLHIANKEATESNRLKSQFLANISHEVRTPLNAILGYTKILQKDTLDNQQRTYVNTIEQSTNNLLAIIGDILDFSKIEAGKLNLEQTDINIRDLIDDVFQILSANLLAGRKQIALIPDINNNVPEWIVGDPIRIRQILTNLIGNAIKFTENGFVQAKVTLSALEKNKMTLVFQIIDSGMGIAENKLNRLFKPFSQADTSTTRQFGGTGLGLVITKKLVEQMKGKISVTSELGNGSNFRFSINLHLSQKEVSPLIKLKKRIILFEPIDTYRQYIEAALSEIGVECVYCSSIEQIITRLKTSLDHDKFDALLLSTDQEINELSDAYELTYFVRNTYSIPCILMAQPPSKIPQLPELQNLASDILLKPISYKRLHQALSQLSCADQPISSQKRTLQGLKILAVDDNSTNLQLVEHWLKPNGLDVILAYSGQQALEMSAKNSFDLILMDIQMPGLDGMETTKELRRRAQYKETPIIALTAHALNSEKHQIIEAGMNTYLTKPVSESTLLDTIHHWCKGTKKEDVPFDFHQIFDLDLSLSIVNNKVEIAYEMFTMLIDSLESEKKLVQHHFNERELQKLIHTVHRIHGASKYCGTPELTKHANYTETHLKELGLEDVEDVLTDFIHAIDNLLDAKVYIKWPQQLQTLEHSSSHQ
ncbi:response regulator [Marinomonas sp. 2405UD68-3]|uniref:response regulator n=1 Tax=Marinomonas sp. 2405UD68-3 TaxID=3391835 RepID=UPI0039C94FF9